MIKNTVFFKTIKLNQIERIAGMKKLQKVQHKSIFLWKYFENIRVESNYSSHVLNKNSTENSAIKLWNEFSKCHV